MAGRYRYVIASALFVAGAINYMDRAALGIVAPLVRKDLHLSPSQLGIIFSSFFVGYAIFAFLGGQLADRFGPRRVYSWAMGGWSFMCGLTALVTGFTSLLLCRLLFGFGEGPMNATTNRTITNWFPRQETATMVGFIFSGQTCGSAFTGPLVGLIALAVGWRISFVVIALIGFAWVFFWRMLATDFPAQHPRVSKEEARMVQESRATTKPVEGNDDKLPLRSYLLRPSILALGFSLFAHDFALYIFLSWLPSYFTDVFHLNLKSMSFVTAIPWLCGAIGYLGGGLVGDFVYKHMKNAVLARKLCAFPPLGLAGISLLLVSFTTTTIAAVALISVAVMALTAVSPAVWALEHELVPARHLGGVSGFVHLLANVSGIVGPAIMGFAIQYLGGYSAGFLLGALVNCLAVVAIIVLVKTKPRAALAVPAVAG